MSFEFEFFLVDGWRSQWEVRVVVVGARCGQSMSDGGGGRTRSDGGGGGGGGGWMAKTPMVFLVRTMEREQKKF